MTREFNRNDSKEIMVLMEKVRTVIGDWASTNDYVMELVINVNGPVKTLKVSLKTKRSNEESEVSFVPEATC